MALSEFKRGTPFLRTTETLALIAAVLSYTKAAPQSTEVAPLCWALNLWATPQALPLPRHLQAPLQGHGSNPRLHTSLSGRPFKQAESPIQLFPLGA